VLGWSQALAVTGALPRRAKAPCCDCGTVGIGTVPLPLPRSTVWGPARSGFYRM